MKKMISVELEWSDVRIRSFLSVEFRPFVGLMFLGSSALLAYLFDPGLFRPSVASSLIHSMLLVVLLFVRPLPSVPPVSIFSCLVHPSIGPFRQLVRQCKLVIWCPGRQFVRLETGSVRPSGLGIWSLSCSSAE